MDLRRVVAGFVPFAESTYPREMVERQCLEAKRALEERDLDLVYTGVVQENTRGRDEARACSELSRQGFDLLIVCIIGWIPSQIVINVVDRFAHKPMVLWGLTGYTEGGRLITTAAQAGTTALREPMEALGYRLSYVYDCPDSGLRSAEQVARLGKVARAAALLREARVGMMGYRDMNLYVTLVDNVSLRRVVGPEVEVFEMLEIVQRMAALGTEEVTSVIDDVRHRWSFEKPAAEATLEKGVRMYLAVRQKIEERGYNAISLIDVDGPRKLMGFPPAMVLMLLADSAGVASIPENDAMGAVTQLIVRYLTGQVGAYMEFYEFLGDRLLLGVPDYVPAEIADGPVQVTPWPGFGGLSDGLLNTSKVKTGRVTLCRLSSRGDKYRMHVATGEALPPRRWEEAGWAQPAPQLPSLEVIPDCSLADFAKKVLSEHYIISYGDCYQELADLCAMLGIEVI